MPVRNAQQYLAQAIDSLLAQDYPNIEVIVSDNASTDGTAEICRGYARRDQRVAYHRSDENRGAVWNFNQAFALARGPYFMWAAHDDLRDPRCVSKCVAVLEARPEVALCCMGVDFIDETGESVAPWFKLFHPVGPTPRSRVSAIARSRYWVDVYGLIRAEALAKTTLAQPVWGFDVSIELQLSLLGPVGMVDEPLFRYRVDRRKSTAMVASTLGKTESAGAISVNWSAMTLQLAGDVWRSPLGRLHRTLLAAQLLVQMCLFNGLVGSGIRSDLTTNFRQAWSTRSFGRVLLLSAMAAAVFPIHNRLVRSLVRAARRPRVASQVHA